VNFFAHSIMCALMLLTAPRDPDDESQLLFVKWRPSNGVRALAVAPILLAVLPTILPDTLIFVLNGTSMKCTRAFTHVLFYGGPLIALPLSISSFIWLVLLMDRGKSSKEESQA
jgi:hypothetical protein